MKFGHYTQRGLTPVDRSRVREIYFITDLRNLNSILQLGLLCHQVAEARGAFSIANRDVQSRRAAKMVNGLPLHAYVCLYLNARNAMLFEITHRRNPPHVVVLQVTPDVMELPGTMVSDRNAASSRATFRPAAEGLSHLDERLVMASTWNVADPIDKQFRKEIAQAEVLVPIAVPSIHIGGIIAPGAVEAEVAARVAPHLPITVNSYMFFSNA